ncbi:hypothetical protein CPCC7001_757 [Cyanobium sp. PCC 7001]|nr:hypothetical protein CPCC7001_757 [Cyanobium sp. PCC 7001]
MWSLWRGYRMAPQHQGKYQGEQCCGQQERRQEPPQRG